MAYSMEKLHHSEDAPKTMPLQLLNKITNNFSEERKLGSGTYGKVYKGEKNGEEIAVKMLHLTPELDDMEQFKKEFENLRRLRHQNIVRLLGYCYEMKAEYVVLGNGKAVFAENIHRALCFEYMHNGSLQKHLYDEYHGLDWQTRYKIIKGTCEGLRYLHEGLESPIYHLDLKPDNILLDKNMVPKLADFGLSRLVSDKQTQATRSSLGTSGYLPPEYIEGNFVSIKFDIFSLGVVMIRIMTGYEGYHKKAEMSSLQFIDIVHENWRNRLQTTPGCTSLEAECHQVKRCIEIALDCVQADRHKRPKIGNIIHWLNETENIDMSAAPSPLQRIISVPKGSGETSTYIRPGSSEISKLLDIHPLELRFPWEPNKRINCPVTLTNRTDCYVGVWITPTDPQTHWNIRFPIFWDNMEPSSSVFQEMASSSVFQEMEPHSTWVVAMTLEEEQQPQPQDTGKFEVLMIVMGSEEDLKNLRPPYDRKLNMDSDSLKRVEELDGEVHRAMLKAVICDPASCQEVIRDQKSIAVSLRHGDTTAMDVHPTKAWILTGDVRGRVSIGNYQTLETVMALQVVTKTERKYFVCSVKFIAQEQWIATGDTEGWVRVYDYTTMDKVKEFAAHAKTISSLAVHSAHPFLLTSSYYDKTIKLWDWRQGWKCTREFDHALCMGNSIIWNPRDTDTFVSASHTDVKVWEIHSTDPITTFVGFNHGCCFYSDSHRNFMVILSRSGGAGIWDMQTKKHVHTLHLLRDPKIRDAACHQMLPILASVSGRTVSLWDANTYRLEKIVELRNSPIQGMVFIDTKDLTTRLVVGCKREKTIMEINLPTLKTDIRTGGAN